MTLAHDTIREQIEAVEAASRAKGNFLANMSHEIRTPLNAIVGMTELLLESNLAPRQREYAGTVIDSCENLLVIINDVLDFSKIDSGRFQLEHLDFDLREHLGDTPILVLTAADRLLVAQAERACLMKPVKESELLHAILAALGGDAGEATSVRRQKDEVETAKRGR